MTLRNKNIVQLMVTTASWRTMKAVTRQDFPIVVVPFASRLSRIDANDHDVEANNTRDATDG